MKAFLFGLPLLVPCNAHAQPALRLITPDVSFLDVAPDARAAALGQSGVATSPDAVSGYWNPAKLVHLNSGVGATVSAGRWLPGLLNNIWLTQASVYLVREGKSAVAVSAYGSLSLDEQGGSSRPIVPIFANAGFDASYARKLGKNLSMGLTFRYITADGSWRNGMKSQKRGQAVAGDVSLFYTKNNTNILAGRGTGWAIGAVATNLGGYLNYGGGQQTWLPATLRIGGAFHYAVLGRHRFQWSADLSKLMVPSSTVGQPSTQPAAPFQDMLRSFSDAPGGFREEVQEIRAGGGMEYVYLERFALRTGYYGENRLKGGRRFFSVGAGAGIWKGLRADFSYWLPVKDGSPLANVAKISLAYNMVKSAH